MANKALTLNQFSSAMQEIANYINTKSNTKVDKIDGKVLSTNDFSNEEKNKLADLENYDDTPIRQLIAAIDKWDYKIADSAPSSTEVIINNETIPVEPRVRYLVKNIADNVYEEYIVVNGVVYNIGTTQDGQISLSWEDINDKPNNLVQDSNYNHLDYASDEEVNTILDTYFGV